MMARSFLRAVMFCFLQKLSFVMPGLVLGIPTLGARTCQGHRDGRDKPGHDGELHYRARLSLDSCSHGCAFALRFSHDTISSVCLSVSPMSSSPSSSRIRSDAGMSN